MKKPKIVYQYMPYETFEAMMKNKTLKLCDIQHSNDTSELRLASSVIKLVLLEELSKSRGKYDFFSKTLTEKEFNQFLDANTGYIDAAEKIIHTQFVTCFSEKKDLLSMWRGYAEDHREGIKSKGGIAVGFSADALERLATVSETGGEIFTFEKVRYSLGNQKALFRQQVKKEIEKIRLYVKKNNSIVGYDSNPFQIWYHEELIRRGELVKNNFFFEEHEWRLSHWNNNGYSLKKYYPQGLLLSNESWFADMKKKEQENNANIKKAVKTNADVKWEAIPPQYFYLHMDGQINSFIKEIIVGPKCSIKKDKIEKLIMDNKIFCGVSLSRGFDVFVDSSNHK